MLLAAASARALRTAQSRAKLQVVFGSSQAASEPTWGQKEYAIQLQRSMPVACPFACALYTGRALWVLLAHHLHNVLSAEGPVVLGEVDALTAALEQPA